MSYFAFSKEIIILILAIKTPIASFIYKLYSMVKKGKNPKSIDHDQQKKPELTSKNISDAFLDELKGAFTTFDKLPELKRAELYGNKEYLEQFWEYFKKEHPNLLDTIDKKDLPVYIHALENK